MGIGNWVKARAGDLFDAALGEEFRERTGNLPIRVNEFGFDPFGFHRDALRAPYAVARLLYRSYFRCEVHGIANVPAGRVMFVANHAGQLPFDAMCITMAMLMDAEPPRMVRSMVEKFVPTVPFLSTWFTRWGQITGTPENCRRLLDNDEAILVFPEGVEGISKPFSKRYQLQKFGQGFLRLALASRAPIVPIAVVGAEEQAPSINVKSLARLVGAPAFPVSPLPPFLPLPLPVKYHLWFGEPLLFEGDPDDDEATMDDHVRVVRNSIQSMLRIGLQERRGVFW